MLAKNIGTVCARLYEEMVERKKNSIYYYNKSIILCYEHRKTGNCLERVGGVWRNVDYDECNKSNMGAEAERYSYKKII